MGIDMKFSKFDKKILKLDKNFIKELLFLIYISFVVFLFTEILCAKGTTSYGFIENSTICLGGILILILPLSMLFTFKKDTKKYYILEAIFILCLLPVIKYTWDEFYVFLSVPDYSVWCLLLNYLIILLIFSISIFLKKKIFYYFLISGVFLIFSLVNYFVSIFRGIPLAYCDIYCIGDATYVAKDFLGQNGIIMLIAGLILSLICLVILFFKDNKGKRNINFVKIFVVIIMCISTYIYYLYLVESKTLIYYSANMVKTYRYNGYVYSTLESGIRFIRFKPDDYNEEKILSIKDEVKQNTNNGENISLDNDTNKETPNILFVQLEGFMDPKKIEGVLYGRDPIPNFTKLQKTCISGNMKTPSIGGGTARTEFEVMTGINLEFLTDGEVPHYTILGHTNLNSVATTLKKQGYSAHAIHNNQGNFYNRNKAYSALGYDTYTSIEYMENVKKTKTNWAKDEILTDYIKDCLDSTEEHDLVFTISVQGHSPYLSDADKYDFPIKIMSSNLAEIETNQIYYYINQIYETDKFIGEVVDLVDSMEEDTIVVFYGDHTPALDVLTRNGGNVDRTTTPYAIYSNFELQTDFEGGDICAYQMSTLMLSLSGVDLGPMENIHKALSNKDYYKEDLELIEYDILFGKNYYLDEEEQIEKSNLKMGLKDVKIKSAKIEDGELFVEGENFTRNSIIYINNEEKNTIYVDNKNLKVHLEKDEVDSVEDVVVKQVGLRKIALSQSNLFKFNKKIK